MSIKYWSAYLCLSLVFILSVNVCIHFLWEIPENKSVVIERCWLYQCSNEIHVVKAKWFFPGVDLVLDVVYNNDIAIKDCFDLPNATACYYKKSDPANTLTVGVYEANSTLFYYIFNFFSLVGMISAIAGCMAERNRPEAIYIV